MNTPVLLLIFNRPDTTARVFEVIRAAQPARLYVAADGPDRNGGNAQRCEEARRIATSVDWPCELRTLFRNQNVGCRHAVSEAVSWFFSMEPEGIILEDDTLPDASFFPYCAEMLKRYREEPRVMAIQGGSYFGTHERELKSSYAFCKAFDPWGWASWARSWKFYDGDFLDLHKALKNLKNAYADESGSNIVKHWSNVFLNTKSGKVSSWANRWTYSIFLQEGLVAYPGSNLISNIGFRSDATHTRVKFFQMAPPIAKKATNSIDFPLQHPGTIMSLPELELELHRARFRVK